MKFTLLLVLLPALAVAASGGHASNEIPKVVIYQALNVGIFIAILFFATKGKIKNYFVQRKEEFTQAKKQAEHAKQEAEANRNEIKGRLTKLVADEDSSLSRARSEAEDLRHQIVIEAQNLSHKLQEEAQRTIRYELDKAKEELRAELLSESLVAARKLLSEVIQDLDQKRLQREFVEKIKVVQQ